MTVNYMMDLMQGGDEWRQIRIGMLTASQIKLILTPTLKIANNDKTRAHLYEIVAQRAVNYIEPQYESWDMQRGTIEECYAKDLYSAKINQIKDCGFITNDKLGFALGFSPDGLIGDDGLIEAKSRNQKYQIQTIIEDKVPEDYILQIQTGLMVSERKWCDFISYSNGLPMFVQRVYPDQVIIDAISEAAVDFEEKVCALLKKYNANAAKFHKAERRDPEDGTLMKSSHTQETPDRMMAG
jgi:hypothetical protein